MSDGKEALSECWNVRKGNGTKRNENMARWMKEEIEETISRAIRDRKYAMKMARMAKSKERKAYWRGKTRGLGDAILYLRWWISDIRQ